jgi:dsRNA-specific ribonuclease
MAFDKDTGASAGKKSKRGSSKQINEIREVYSDLLHNNKDKLQEWFDEVGKQDPAKALDLMLKMSAFVLPKYKLVESKKDKSEEPIVHVTRWGT